MNPSRPKDLLCRFGIFPWFSTGTEDTIVRLQAQHRKPRSRVLTLILITSASLQGCQQKIREYEIDAERESFLSSEILRERFVSVPFLWRVPKNWRETENNEFSLFAWESGPDEKSVQITVSVLEESAGVESQLVRWRGQVGLSSDADIARDGETLNLGGLSGRWVEYRGESETILGMISRFRGKLWIFKSRGDNRVMDVERSSFRSFCESVSEHKSG